MRQKTKESSTINRVSCSKICDRAIDALILHYCNLQLIKCTKQITTRDNVEY